VHAVDFQPLERPGAFESAKLFDVASQMWPVGEAAFALRAKR
jgi:hypothetical protein